MALNGFSTCNSAVIGTYKVPGTRIYLAVRREIAPLLIGYAAEYHRLVEPIDVGIMDCWGYACRRVRGRATVSKHAAGIAIDLNATKYPLGVRDRHTARQKATIRLLCKKYGLTYGGDWSRPDAMHTELAESRTAALARVRRLQTPPTTSKPPTKVAVPRLSKIVPGARNSDVVLLQQRLAKLGFNPGPADGIYGPRTKAAVAAFQRKQGWRNSGSDGAVGPMTLDRLF